MQTRVSYDPIHRLNKHLKITMHSFLERGKSYYGLIGAVNEDGRLALISNNRVNDPSKTRHYPRSTHMEDFPAHLAIWINAVQMQSKGGFNPFEGWSMFYITPRKEEKDYQKVTCIEEPILSEFYDNPALIKMSIPKPNPEVIKQIQAAVNEYQNIPHLKEIIKIIEFLMDKNEIDQAAYFDDNYHRLKDSISNPKWLNEMHEAIDFVSETKPQAKLLKTLVDNFIPYTNTKEFKDELQRKEGHIQKQNQLNAYASSTFRAPEIAYVPEVTFGTWLKAQKAAEVSKQAAIPLVETKELPPQAATVVAVHLGVQPLADLAPPPAYDEASVDSPMVSLPSAESKEINAIKESIEGDDSLVSSEGSAKTIKLSNCPKEKAVIKAARKIFNLILKDNNHHEIDPQDAKKVLEKIRNRAKDVVQASESKGEVLSAKQLTFFRKIAGIPEVIKSPEAVLISTFKPLIIENDKINSGIASLPIQLPNGVVKNVSLPVHNIYQQILDVETKPERAKDILLEIKRLASEAVFEDCSPEEMTLYRTIVRKIKDFSAENASNQHISQETNACSMNR